MIQPGQLIQIFWGDPVPMVLSVHKPLDIAETKRECLAEYEPETDGDAADYVMENYIPWLIWHGYVRPANPTVINLEAPILW